MANEPLQGARYPTLADAPDMEKAFVEALADVVPRTNMRFTTENAMRAAIPSPVAGMEAYTGSGSSAVKWIYHNGDWRKAALAEAWVPLSFVAGYAGTARYKVNGSKVEVRWTYTTSIAPGAAVFPIFVVPESVRPTSDVPATVIGTGQYPMAGTLSAAGNMNIRNSHSALLTAHSGICVYELG